MIIVHMKRDEKLPEEQIKKDIAVIVKGKYPEEKEAIIGENRGQLFVRIPKLVAQRMGITQKHKMVFKMYAEKGKQRLEVEFR